MNVHACQGMRTGKKKSTFIETITKSRSDGQEAHSNTVMCLYIWSVCLKVPTRYNFRLKESMTDLSINPFKTSDTN